jgi:hypothetical protein
MTPRELGAAFAAEVKRVERRQRESLWLAWHMAAFSRQRRLASFDSLTRRMGGDTARQTSTEQIAIAHQITALVNASKRAG